MSAATAGHAVTETEPRTPALQATVEEFLDFVRELRRVAGVLEARAELAAPALTFDEAVRLVDELGGSVGQVDRASGRLAAQAAALWDAGQQIVLEIAETGEEVEVTRDPHKHDRRDWDHAGIAREVVERHLRALAAAGQPAPDPYTVAGWIIEAAQPSYWRLSILQTLGIDASKFCRRRWEKVRTKRLRKTAVA